MTEENRLVWSLPVQPMKTKKKETFINILPDERLEDEQDKKTRPRGRPRTSLREEEKRQSRKTRLAIIRERTMPIVEQALARASKGDPVHLRRQDIVPVKCLMVFLKSCLRHAAFQAEMERVIDV